MTSDSAPILVDTNVLVYAYDSAEAIKQRRAAYLLEVLASADRGRLTTQVLSEFFVTVTRKIPTPLSLAEAERTVANYLASWTVLTIHPGSVSDAISGMRRYGLNYWDALIWATARRHGIKTILSEDFADGTRLGGVLILNPFVADFSLP